MTLMRIHIDDNFADDIDGVVDGNDDCDDDGIGNIDFVLVVLFQGLPIMGNFLAENLTFPPMDLLNSATLHALYLYCLYCICIYLGIFVPPDGILSLQNFRLLLDFFILVSRFFPSFLLKELFRHLVGFNPTS